MRFADMMNRRWIIAMMLAMLSSQLQGAEDWPMYRGDAARSAFTTNNIPSKLQLAWKREARHKPSPAWSGQRRLEYDHTYHPVVFDGLVFFGSSTDHKIYALDATTGQTVWTFFTDAPVRVAPAADEHGLYVGSDDGVLYCLDVKSGKLKWKLRGADKDDRIMGNDRLISRWPVRGGPVVHEGVVYFAAGIWPTEGLFVCAVDARSGKVIWRNSDSGSMVSDKPRAGRDVKSGPGAQGHLAVGAGVLVVPTGRGAPAVYDLKSGKIKHFHHSLYVNKASGGTKASVMGQLVIFGENYPSDRRGHKTRVCTPSDGRNVSAEINSVNANHPKMIITGESSGLEGFAKQTAERQRTERDGKVTKYLSMSREPVWKCRTPFRVRDIITNETTAVVAGTAEIAIIDIKSQKIISSVKVAGKIQSLAAANNCIYAAAEDGTIYCFSEQGQTQRPAILAKAPAAPGKSKFTAIAKDILSKTKITQGYCLDIGCRTGELAAQLAANSKLYLYGVETDRAKVLAARAKFDALGLYGTRVTILHVKDLNRLPFTGRFAELVVSSKALSEGVAFLNAETASEMLCPYLGAACLGKTDNLTVTPGGPVKGAGNWTHFYADAHNSYCGTDTALHGPLELLWFRDTDYPMANRHSMSSPTMVYNGYMVMPGEHGVRVANAYNGRPIWQHDIKGLNLYQGGFSYDRRKLSGNMCVADGKVYVRHLDYCRQFDITTGKMLGQWKIPAADDTKKPQRWGYIACKDGVLYGSVANAELVVNGYPEPGSRTAKQAADLLAKHPTWAPNHHQADSTRLFAMDAASGKLKWVHHAKHSIRNTTIAIGAATVYFMDKPITHTDDYRSRVRGKVDADKLNAKAKALAKQRGTTLEAEIEKLKNPRGRIVALDSQTGKVKWRSDENTGPAELLAVSSDNNALMMGGKSGFSVFNAASGKPLWKGGWHGRPMVYRKELRFGGRVIDLLTGKTIRSLPRMRGSYCTPVLGSPNLLAFRVGVIGYVDLANGRGTEYFGGIRPGCYVDMTPAGGLLVMSDGAAGCSCSYLNQCSIALQPKRTKRE
ncbi:MAG: PQQ-binding-like beta-propeller repeat protein [Phycisphaerales bacterium]|nr:PQQ-binding-like beta-propeller repeat protein [Phycisphaerales bacterium]